MRRFLGNKILDEIVIYDPAEVKHIIKVNRNKVGDHIEVIVNDSCFECIIKEISKKEVHCGIIEEVTVEKKYQLTLIISSVKNNKLEELIRHATELGVGEIIITNTKRTSVKFFNDKIDRYKKIIVSALKQSKSYERTNIKYMDYHEIDFSKFSEVLVLHTKEKTNRFSNVKDNSAIFIGPEGGFDETEIDEMISRGARVINMGDNILRAETAVVSAVSIFLHELGVM